MKKLISTTFVFCGLLASICLVSCQRNCYDVVEDGRTAGRYVGKSVKSMFGKNGDSREVMSSDEFGIAQNRDFHQNEFVPLQDYDSSESSLAFTHRESIPQPEYSPGDSEGPVPGIESFHDPMNDPNLEGIFRNIKFPYNSNLIAGEQNQNTIKGIVRFMKQRANSYVFVEGHCDERGPQAYNLALGTRRANSIRAALVEAGADVNNVFTTSYGKERPLMFGHDDISWSENRRGQFKVYTQ
jgi:peptidoglycan-associated lipoprotein